MIRSMVVAAAVFGLSAGAAQAAVIYDVAGQFAANTDNDELTPDEVFNFTFSYTAPTFITSLTQAAPTSCTITGTFYQCAATSTFDPGSTTFTGIDDDYFGFDVDNTDMTGGGTAFYFFEGGAFGAVGTYSNAGQPDPGGSAGNAGPAMLTVTQTGAAPVPEPSTWAMMLAGFGLVGGAMRRRGGMRLRFA